MYEGKGRDLRILVIEDFTDVSTSLWLAVSELGYHTYAVPDGASAANISPKLKPNVVLMRLSEPESGCYETAATLRRLIGADLIMMIAIAETENPGQRGRSAAAGIDHHLVGPLNGTTLKAILQWVGWPVMPRTRS